MYQKQINVNLADSCPLDFAAALEASQRSVGTPPGPTNPTTITNYKHNSQCDARINDLTYDSTDALEGAEAEAGSGLLASSSVS